MPGVPENTPLQIWRGLTTSDAVVYLDLNLPTHPLVGWEAPQLTDPHYLPQYKKNINGKLDNSLLNDGIVVYYVF